jgi:hypothetical protein
VDTGRRHRRGQVARERNRYGTRTDDQSALGQHLHFVLDEWFENEVKPRIRGVAHEIRFADDAVLCFQYKEGAEKVMEVLPKRFAKYGLTTHPEKTRLLEFGRYFIGNMDPGFENSCATIRTVKGRSPEVKFGCFAADL